MAQFVKVENVILNLDQVVSVERSGSDDRLAVLVSMVSDVQNTPTASSASITPAQRVGEYRFTGKTAQAVWDYFNKNVTTLGD